MTDLPKTHCHVLVTPPWEFATWPNSLASPPLLKIFDLNCAIIMSDDEERYNVSLLSLSNRMILIMFSLKARPGPQQRYLAKDIFGSDSELSDAPDGEGK
jgi:hypothetical protein